MTTPGVSENPPARRQSTWGLLLSVLFAPRTAMAKLAQDHNWAPVVVVQGLLGMALLIPAVSKLIDVALENARRNAARAPGAAMPPGMDVITRITVWFTVTAGPWIGPLFFALLVSVLLLIMNAILQDQVSYQRLFGLAMWAAFPAAVVGSILQGVFTFLTPTEKLFGAASGFNASLTLFFTHLPATGTAHALLSSVNLFSLWTAAMLGIGYAAFSGRRGAGPVVVGVVYWLVGALFTVLGAAVMAAFTPA